ncbi:Hydantoinase B/oxoprolinase-domain-containing protein [Microdochium trichocladiopsis]|uniref:Hydantoinase B/oxoprolinase-domain-containing protein n=1 Tax=Microdochium trichocladiopsis TaxID=1682393 RepID=A0A9P8Y1M5_9PEZI|nr:Hydantoinase B/oxoprolinase-domain-containing protein [Microdochium trichocladiopsis]KAH7025162.1 Hydantoinase B/oxoprolinase-domain-containing protein [Microdochium trichocladiopsis]
MTNFKPSGIRIAIDRGGTFTDAWAWIPDVDEKLVVKVLSQSPEEYSDAPTECIRQILEIASGRPMPRGTPLNLDAVESIRMGTTVATNALLERKGEPTALVITKGFRDILEIGNQARPHIFDLSVRRMGKLYETVVEVDERVTIEGFTEHPEPKPVIDVGSDSALVKGLSGEVVRIIKAPDYDQVRKDLSALWDRGYRSVAVAMLHSYTFQDHEQGVAKVAQDLGFRVSASSELTKMAKIVPRSQSAVADAYLSPVTDTYLEGFRKGFEGHLEDHNGEKLLLNQSDGGLTTFSNFTGLRGVLSGPAGGVIGLSKTCYNPDNGTPVLGFDMGGTSTDVARYDGSLAHIFESTIAEVTIQTPQLDISTVAAGGGSILRWENGLLKVGPGSAGANPGPACYGRGGPLTVTDANFFLGRIVPDLFPRPLDKDVVRNKFEALTVAINEEKAGEVKLTAEEVAIGFLNVANATMTRPIRTLSEGRGFEAGAHNLGCFGGAGGQHAVAVARDLGIRRVIIPRYSSILSAFGMALADVVIENQEPETISFSENAFDQLQGRFDRLCAQGAKSLQSQGFPLDQVRHELFLNMRYEGSDTSLTIPHPGSIAAFNSAFITRHQQEFGFTQTRSIIVDDVRVRSVGQGADVQLTNPFEELRKVRSSPPATPSKPRASTQVYFDVQGWTETGLHYLNDLPVGSTIRGPAMVVDKTQTIVLDPSSAATVLPEHLILEILDVETAKINTETVDPVQLSIFGHRFMSVAEQMGQTMQKTSISVNIKERLDFSCAIFSATGGLVANAPHIPGHLGSMSYAIAYQAKLYGPGELKPGDVLLSNHPCSGGTHLPDLTVTTPVFSEDDPSKILFFVANRGHHADIGGIQPGSMPPHSTELWQEGVAVETFKIVKEGVFDDAGLHEILVDTPASYPGCSGTRTLKDNIADLKAAIASNNRGIQLINGLVKEYTWPVVEYYMEAIQQNAAQCVRDLLKGFSRRFEGQRLQATDYLDDGTVLSLQITIDAASGDAVFDFEGTGPEHFGNLNCPPAVMLSGIMYCLRSMVATDMPLNQGCLDPIKLKLPPNTILSPSLKAATVGSNVETSQRIVDLVFKAFQACAASQGTCNNLTFGYGGTDSTTGKVVKGFGYYETIAGGSGAGADWQGESGVHTHVTNTRMSDPEIFEKRYPVLLHEFSVRRGSGGDGLNRGGDGCVRDIEFRMPLQVSILSERRVIAPYGMAGGDEGKRGLNLWIRKDPSDETTRTISLGGKATTMMNAGDRIIVMTPGGGGYGPSPNKTRAEQRFGVFKIGDKFAAPSRAGGSVAQRAATAEGN